MHAATNDFHFTSTWCLEAPRPAVWAAVSDCARWPIWWPAYRSATCLAPGDADGVGARWRFVIRSALPFSLAYETVTTRSEAPALIEGRAVGDLVGSGRWELRAEGRLTVVTYTNKASLDRVPGLLVRPIRTPLAWNHNHMMEQGARALARHLGVRLLATRHEVHGGSARPARGRSEDLHV